MLLFFLKKKKGHIKQAYIIDLQKLLHSITAIKQQMRSRTHFRPQKFESARLKQEEFENVFLVWTEKNLKMKLVENYGLTTII